MVKQKNAFNIQIQPRIVKYRFRVRSKETFYSGNTELVWDPNNKKYAL